MDGSNSKKAQLKALQGEKVVTPNLTLPNSKPKAKPNNQGSSKRKMNYGWLKLIGVFGIIVAGLGLIFVLNTPGSTTPGGGQAGQYPYQVGTPGQGTVAPPILLTSTQGRIFNLASQRGKTVLIFFQEGVMCQPCWDQIKDVEVQFSKFKDLGIDSFVSVTTDNLDQIRQLVTTQRISTPVLSDPNLAVSKSYSATSYGMMGDTRDGHTFIVVGPDGVIRWRADYGGAPKYTMYLPVNNLLADLQLGLTGAIPGK